LDQTDKTPAINAYDLKTRKVTRVHSLDHVSAGITVSPDGKWLIYTELAEAGSHITLVENFR
jgi:Tol biopolymer transport system component